MADFSTMFEGELELDEEDDLNLNDVDAPTTTSCLLAQPAAPAEVLPTDGAGMLEGELEPDDGCGVIPKADDWSADPFTAVAAEPHLTFPEPEPAGSISLRGQLVDAPTTSSCLLAQPAAPAEVLPIGATAAAPEAPPPRPTMPMPRPSRPRRGAAAATAAATQEETNPESELQPDPINPIDNIHSRVFYHPIDRRSPPGVDAVKAAVADGLNVDDDLPDELLCGGDCSGANFFKMAWDSTLDAVNATRKKPLKGRHLFGSELKSNKPAVEFTKRNHADIECFYENLYVRTAKGGPIIPGVSATEPTCDSDGNVPLPKFLDAYEVGFDCRFNSRRNTRRQSLIVDWDACYSSSDRNKLERLYTDSTRTLMMSLRTLTWVTCRTVRTATLHCTVFCKHRITYNYVCLC